ncbi:MAG: hypothetical protein RMN51_08720 [Verrucomicrobiota bacterium]|nr:hypothetical protein [Limisphaera sp.]MDW8382173.1 hypothetical protein [Verrucomicrobiota bacterium]
MSTEDAFDREPTPATEEGASRTRSLARGRRRGRGRGGVRDRAAGPDRVETQDSGAHLASDEPAGTKPDASDIPEADSDAARVPQAAPEPVKPETGSRLVSRKPAGRVDPATLASEGSDATAAPLISDQRRALDEALRRLQDVVVALKEITEDLEEAAELLDLAAEYKEEMNREIDRLNRLLNQLQRPREGQRAGGPR